MCSVSCTQTSTLIAARPGLFRDSLLVFLRTMPRVKVVALVDDPTKAMAAVRRHQPHTLVIDANGSEKALLNMMQKLHDELPATNSVVLVNTHQHQQTFLALGVTSALLKGSLDKRLLAAVLENDAHKTPLPPSPQWMAGGAEEESAIHRTQKITGDTI